MTPSWPESLTEAQIAELKASAITPVVAQKQGLYSLDDPKAAAKLFGRTAAQWSKHVPVTVYPYRLPFQRDPVLVRGKPAHPFEQKRKDGSIELAKYTQAKDTGTHIFFGPSLVDGTALRDEKIPLLASEGEKKALAAESAGFACVSLPGVSQWHVKGEKQLHPYFAHLALRGREVFLCFDADSLANKDVRREELAFGRALEAQGARVYIVRFPPDAAKLDDFLATHEISEFYLLLDDARKRGALPPDTNSPNVSEEWQAVFTDLRLDGDSGLPIKDVDNISRIFLHHPAWQGVLSFDARRERQTFTRQPPFALDVALEKAPIPRAVTDTDITRMADWLSRQTCLGWTLQPKPSQLEQAVSVVCERNRIDGVQTYLAALTWDKIPRLDNMAQTYFEAADEDAGEEESSDFEPEPDESPDYTSTVFAKWMLSAVARARTPGCQVDHVIVLEGPQGIGKSSALRILAGADFFMDTLPELGRDAHEACIGPWVIELAELDHMRRTEVTALKAFISARAPSFRGAYARRTVEHPRRCVFAATTNDSQYLADSTGNRRFWPIECTRIDLEALARDRDQLWAEAVARVRAGESWHITDERVAAKAAEAQAARRQADPWQPQVIAFVKGRAVVTVGEVLDYLGFGPEEDRTFVKGRKGWHYDQRNANRVSAILRELGWTRRMVRNNGQRVWKYHSADHEKERVTARKERGDKGVTGQVSDIRGQSPPSPVSPDKSHRGVNASSVPFSNSSVKENSSDTGDSGDLGGIADSCPGSTKSPPADVAGDVPGAPLPREKW